MINLSFVNKAKNFANGLKEKPKYLYTPEEEEEFEAYISRNFGEYSKVYHELYSPDIHVDILIIPPSEKRNYYKLITMGMGAYKMNVPNQLKGHGLERAELVAFLPPEWDLKIDNSIYSWVIGELKTLSRMPIIENSWVGLGHTFSNDEKSEIPFSKATKLTSSILLPAITNNFGEYHVDLKLPGKGTINFYQFYPLYKEELEYIKQYGLEEFSNLIPDEELLPIINPVRSNYCETKFNNIEEQNVKLNDCEEEIEK